MTNDPGERRDLKDERDEELYKAMIEHVRETYLYKIEMGYIDVMPDGLTIHNEAMALLKEDYE